MASFFRTTLDNFLNNITPFIHANSNFNPSNSGHRSQSNPRATHRTSTRQQGSTSSSTNRGRTTRNGPPPHSHQFRSQPTVQQTNMSNRATSNANADSANKSTETIDIKDIRDLNEINHLSARQLKTILTTNCIGFKGVFEKEVLREKVMQLWIDHNERRARRLANRVGNRNRERSQDSSDDIDENQLCKICMEREINCVLLECGHYLTCVTCGKKLVDCPICRQSVTRCVRTFKG